MSLGFAFVRPQSVKQAPGKDAFRAFELAGDFIDSLLKDPEGARAVGIALAESGGEALPNFLLTRQEPLRKAEGKIRLLFRPLAGLLGDFLDGMGSGIADTLPAALRGLKGLVAFARADSATRFLRELIHLAQTDLEVTPEAAEALFRSLVDGAVTRLQARVIAGDLSEEALNRYEWGVNLKSLELLILEELDWPALDLEILVDALQDLYRRTGFEDLLGKFERVLDAAGDVVEPLGKILETVLAPSITVGGSVGAAAADGSAASVSPGDPVSHYASWVLQKTARFKVEESTTQIAPICWITYKHINPHGMEQVALHTAWISDLAGMVFHMISAEKGDMAGNILNIFWDAGDLIATVASSRIPNWADWVFTPIITLAGGLERVRCSGGADAMYPITLLLGDGGETMLYRRWRWLFRESLLSFLTLYNHDPEARTRWTASGSPAEVAFPRGSENETWPVAFNNDQFQGLCYLFGEVGTFLLPAILSKTDRMNYGFIGGGPSAGMVGKAFGGMGISWLMHWCSLFLCKVTAGEYPNDTWDMILLPLRERYIEKPRDEGGAKAVRVVHGIIVGGVIEWAMQVIYLYLFTNGNTSDGKFSAQDRQNLDFSGHSDTPANSPYKLPWAEGNEQECVQNPMGIWSHYPDDGQAYAYDFNHDAGTEVLCSRSGIVYEMDQVHLNNNTSDWNHIEILALKTHPAGTANAMPGVSPPAGVTLYADGFNAIEAGTLFPPFWDVNGVAWPCLRTAETLTTPPPPIPLHPSAAILPAATTLTGGLAAGTLFTFVDPDFDRGFPGVAYPDGSKFSDGTTAIPAGVVFAPDAPRPPTLITPMYRPGTSFGPVRVNFAAKPYAEPGAFPSTGGFTPAPGATFLDGVPIPAGVILPPDCGATPAWLPLPHPVTPMYLPGTMFLPITDVKFFNAGTGYVAEGTPFPAIPVADAEHSTAELNHQWCTPITHTFCEYGHALAGYSSLQNHTFDPATATTPAVVRKLIIGATRTPIPGTPREDLTDVFGTAENSEILGRRVEQGRVIMLSGDTGISAYNHLHTHVSHFASKRRFQKDRPDKNGQYYYWTFSLPFAYADAVHSVEHGFREAGARDGVPRAMTWYDSKNTRTGP